MSTASSETVNNNSELPTWDTISQLLRTRLAGYAGAMLSEELIAEIRGILHEVLSDIYIRDEATGLYWLTGAQAGMIGQGELGVSGDAVASFACEMAPLTAPTKLSFTLRQVSPFTFEAQESSASCDEPGPDDLPGRGLAGPDADAGSGSASASLCALGGSDSLGSVGSLAGPGTFPPGDVGLYASMQRRAPWSLLD